MNYYYSLCTFAIYLEFLILFFFHSGICRPVTILWIIIIWLGLSYTHLFIFHISTEHNWSEEQGIHAALRPFSKLSLYCNHYMCIIYLLFWWWLFGCSSFTFHHIVVTHYVLMVSHYTQTYCRTLISYFTLYTNCVITWINLVLSVGIIPNYYFIIWKMWQRDIENHWELNEQWTLQRRQLLLLIKYGLLKSNKIILMINLLWIMHSLSCFLACIRRLLFHSIFPSYFHFHFHSVKFCHFFVQINGPFSHCHCSSVDFWPEPFLQPHLKAEKLNKTRIRIDFIQWKKFNLKRLLSTWNSCISIVGLCSACDNVLFILPICSGCIQNCKIVVGHCLCAPNVPINQINF